MKLGAGPSHKASNVHHKKSLPDPDVSDSFYWIIYALLPLLPSHSHRYQGRDKACIIISFVRSNPELSPGKLLNDWQRINVALTRAKTKLVRLYGPDLMHVAQIGRRGCTASVNVNDWCRA